MNKTQPSTNETKVEWAIPVMEVVNFDTSDVITTSNDNWGEWAPQMI